MPRSLSLPFLLCALLSLLCTCDRAQKTLFQERTNTGIDNVNQLTETEDFNIIEYLYFYNGGGVAATDINGDELPDLYFTNNQGPNKYYINEGNFKFRDATDEGGVAGAGDWSTGVSVVDVNADGLMDIYVCNVSDYKGLTGKNELFVQQADGTFTEQAAVYGLDYGSFNTQAYWFDYDRDGDLDVYLIRHAVHADAGYAPKGRGATKIDSLSQNLLLRNDLNNDSDSPSNLQRLPSPRERGRGRGFTNITSQSNLTTPEPTYTLSATIADFNQDSFPDIYTANDFAGNDHYYLSNGDGTFIESVETHTGHISTFSMGSDVGDFNHDRWPELLTLDMRPSDETLLKSTQNAFSWNEAQRRHREGYHHQTAHNALQWNRRDGHFSEIAEMAGLAASDWSWGCLIEDFDLDGRLDVFLHNGIERRPNDLDYLRYVSSDLARSASNLEVIAAMPPGHVANQAYRMTGEWAFEEVGKAWGLDHIGSTTGAATADFDRDGDADLVVNNLNGPAKIYENTYVRPKRSPGAAFNPTSPSARRYDPNSRMCPQRGFLSQSEGAYGRDYGTAARYEPRFEVIPTGVFHETTPSDFFDRDPLAPYKSAPGSYPLIHLKDSTYAIAIDDTGNQFRIYRWDGERLTGDGRTVAYPGIRPRQLKGPARMPLKVPLLQNGLGLYAKPFAGIELLMDGGTVLPAVPQTGIWQSLSLISGDGGPGTILLAGNLGLNTSFGTLTAEEPLRLYLEDTNGDGKVSPLLTYVREGREVPLNDLDELAAAIPEMKKENPTYADFAGKTFGEIFPGLKEEPRKVTTLHHLLLTRQNGQNWTVDTLPDAAQLTTINTALEIESGILLGGNKMDMQPRIGRQDGAALQLWNPQFGFLNFIDLGGERNRQEVRQLVRLDAGHVLVLVAGGEHLVLAF